MEWSRRRVARHIGLAGSSYFLSVSEEDLEKRAELKILTEDTRVLYDIASEVRGTAVYPVKSQNLWPIDNTAFWRFGGLSNLNDKPKLTTKELVKSCGSELIWTLDEGNDFKGIRVSMTFAFSAAGTCLPSVVCVSGLSKQELLGTDFLELEVLWMYIGGGSNIKNKGLGYILFMRNGEGEKQRKFEWYQETIFVSGVNDNRFEFNEIDTSLNMEIPVEDTAIAYCDGDIPQMKIISGSLDLYEEAGIVFNKHCPVSSSVGQVVYRCLIFKILKDQ